MSIAAHTLFGNTVIADDGLVPVNQDVVSQSIGVDAAGRLDSTLSSKLAAEVTEAYLKGPSQMRDLLDPELDLHIRNTEEYVFIETSPANTAAGWSSFLTIWNRSPNTLELEKCSTFSYEFGIAGKAYDAPNRTLAVLSDDRIHLYEVKESVGGSKFEVTGSFHVDELGLEGRPTHLEFEEPGVLSLAFPEQNQPAKVVLKAA